MPTASPSILPFLSEPSPTAVRTLTMTQVVASRLEVSVSTTPPDVLPIFQSENLAAVRNRRSGIEALRGTPPVRSYEHFGSPVLRRAGLLQPRSFVSQLDFGSLNGPPTPSHRALSVSHSQSTIRMSTVQLSSISFSPPPPFAPPSFIFPPTADASESVPTSSAASIANQFSQSQMTINSDASSASGLSVSPPSSSSSSSSFATQKPPSLPPVSPPPLSQQNSRDSTTTVRSGQITPRLSTPPTNRPSGISLLRQEYQNSGSDGAQTPSANVDLIVTPSTPTALATASSLPDNLSVSPSPPSKRLRSLPPGESTPLLPHHSPTPFNHRNQYDAHHEEDSSLRQVLHSPHPPSPLLTPLQHPHLPHRDNESFGRNIWSLQGLRNKLNFYSLCHPHLHVPDHAAEKARSAAVYASKVAVKSLPAVLLGALLNILDGISYGLIIFPGTGVFADLGPMGVSMFFLSSFVAQLVYTLGGSEFAGANGSMMIEVVPFFHVMASQIASDIGDGRPNEVIATTITAFALSSVLTGLSFFLLGALRLGNLIGFFPRHILVGCIGGVGAFLIQTGFSVSMRISEDDLGFDWQMLRTVFGDAHNVTLWAVPLALAILLRVITNRWHHQLIFPLYFLVIPVVFYIIVAAAHLNLDALRSARWLFEKGKGDSTPWYQFYSYFDINLIRFGSVLATLPTQFALLFFNILHPPLNVPALSVSLDEDIDTNKELVAHGYSNFLAGLFGTVPNYLVYVNTLLFYRVGGNTRVAGFLLAIANLVLLFIGTAPIAYIPVLVVGALIFVLGIDLVKEAVWDTRHKASRTEYITIISIMICMTAWDFVVGVLFGIIMSCFFFVVQNSRRKSIRALHTGDTAMSTVRRPSLQRAYLREVSKQTTILRLQGFLFFGTISKVEDTIRSIIEGPSWHTNPVRFLLLDLSLVPSVDMSAAEAFVRVQRFLAAKAVTLVFCGFDMESPVAKALESVEVLGADNVEVFSTFYDAMEWTENSYLRAWFLAQKHELVPTAFTLPGRQDYDVPVQSLDSFVASPRRSFMRDVGSRTIANELQQRLNADLSDEPYNTIVKAFSSYGEIDPELFHPIKGYLQRICVPEGSVLWQQDEPPDGLYIVEAGILRASYRFAEHVPAIEESMVPGTVAGELSALSSLQRNATVVVEQDAVLWKLTRDNLVKMDVEQPKLARAFVGLILKAAKVDHDILMAALASRL